MSEEIESNESNEDNISLNQAEVCKSKKSCCCTLRRTLIFCSVLFGNCVICCLITLVIMGVLFSGLSSIRKYLIFVCNSMNNLLSYCGLVDARISASEKYLPVHKFLS